MPQRMLLNRNNPPPQLNPRARSAPKSVIGLLVDPVSPFTTPPVAPRFTPISFSDQRTPLRPLPPIIEKAPLRSRHHRGPTGGSRLKMFDRRDRVERNEELFLPVRTHQNPICSKNTRLLSSQTQQLHVTIHGLETPKNQVFCGAASQNQGAKWVESRDDPCFSDDIPTIVRERPPPLSSILQLEKLIFI